MRRPTPRFVQRDHTSPAVDSMADESKKPPPPPKSPPPPGKPRQIPPPGAKPRPRKAPPKGRPRPTKKKRAAPPGRKPKPKKPPKAKKGRRIKIKLGLKTKAVSEETDTYTDQVGWTTFDTTSKSSTSKEMEVVTKKGPETTTHQCTMCGARMEIPAPKRDRYKVICAHPDCGHVDVIGLA